MLRKMNQYMRGESGQGMTEYIIIVCLIAIACLLAVGIFGSNIRNLFSGASDSLANGQATTSNLNSGPGAKDVRINDFTD